MAITILNVLGHFVLGFEQSWAQPLVALAAAYGVELTLESVGAWAERRPVQFRGGWCALLDFLLPAHITALAVSMLLYANDRLWPIAFAAALGVASKTLIRVPVGRGVRHCLNPSNTGIAFTLLLFPWIGIAPPYQFTENLSGVGDWLLPTIIVVSGTFLNTRFTGRIPLILGWLGGFLLQAALRSQIQGTPFVAALLPVTGMAFLLFTFYMVTDPATTPSAPLRQFAFGGGGGGGLRPADAHARGLRPVLLAPRGLLDPRTGACVVGRRSKPGAIVRPSGRCRLAWRSRPRRCWKWRNECRNRLPWSGSPVSIPMPVRRPSCGRTCWPAAARSAACRRNGSAPRITGRRTEGPPIGPMRSRRR